MYISRTATTELSSERQIHRNCCEEKKKKRNLKTKTICDEQ